MKPLSLQEIATLSGGRLLRGNPDDVVTSVSTDSRKLPPGALFVALVGDRFDGHDFLHQAASAGAILVSRPPRDEDLSPADGRGVIQVADTLKGLQSLARGYRNLLPSRAVVITGSNGKTSTKDMIRTVLGGRFRVSATQGNLNNHIGLPLSVLATAPDDVFAVWEIGMNHSGEIAPLAQIAQPDIGVITHIGTAHIGHLGSQQAIAEEKGRLAEALSSQGVLVLNANDPFTPYLKTRTQARVVTAGIDAGDIQGSHLELRPDGCHFQLHLQGSTYPVDLPIPGRHMAANALLAAAVGAEAGLSGEEIASALSAVSITPGRLQILEHRGLRIINDAYNANPDSMRASLATVGAMTCSGKKFALLGAMGELGHTNDDAHREIGDLALQEGFQHLVSVGDAARLFTDHLQPGGGQSVHHFKNHQEAANFLEENAAPGDLILLKGSRAASMDNILNLLPADPA